MSNDVVRYINRGPRAQMKHRLVELLRESGQNKAPAKQWRAFIAALAQKGVKQSEIDESAVMPYLSGSDERVVERSDLLRCVEESLVTIKEVELANPVFPTYRFRGGSYAEFLYIANSQRDNVQDEIEATRFDIEDLNFNLERVIEEPDLLDRLEARLLTLKLNVDSAPDFATHHYSDAVNGKHGKNLVGHVRRTIRGDTYFIDEFQSDWAQRGRKVGADGRSLFESGWVPHGPYVTKTEEWAGLLLRIHASLAANNPSIKQFAWINAELRNGRVGISSDGLQEFYGKILPKLASKMLGKSDSKVELMDVTVGDEIIRVPGFKMTDSARKQLLAKQPMYSHMTVAAGIEPACEMKNAVLSQCKEMLGSVATARMVNRLYDIHTAKRVAGQYVNKMVFVSMEAQDLPYSANHECFHAAYDLMMGDYERELVRRAFEPGSDLHFKVKDHLIEKGELSAAAQCEDPEEAAAHGFALWREGCLDVADPEVTSLFGRVVSVMRDFGRWVRERVLGDGHQTPQALFESLANGELARRREVQAERVAVH